MRMRFWGIILWLFAFNVFAATSGGLLAQNPWLDVGTALVMFSVATFMLGQGLHWNSDLSHIIVLLLIVAASGLLTMRIYGQVNYRWFDLMTVMAAPQMVAMAIGFWLRTRYELAEPLASA
ncbi:hypothetical protein ACFL2U_03095 [Patescibacteria group bacterium]